MATTKTQRIGIWIIALFMVIGTVGSFAIIILSNKNSQSDKDRFNTLYSQYQADVAAQTKQLSDKYFPTFSPYLSRATPFDASSVTSLGKEDLVVGTGDAITSQSSFTAYYIGWNPSGKIFDSSFSDDKKSLKAPFSVTPGSVIRELTIPASLAYGSTGSGTDIPANTPLKFDIFIIPTPTPVPVSNELNTLYSRLYGNGQNGQ